MAQTPEAQHCPNYPQDDGDFYDDDEPYWPRNSCVDDLIEPKQPAICVDLTKKLEQEGVTNEDLQ